MIELEHATKKYGAVTALQDVSFSVDVPQQQYNSVTYSNYGLRLDLSRISGTGDIPAFPY